MIDDPLIQIEGLGKVRLSQAKAKAEGLIARAYKLSQGSESGGYVTWPDVQQVLFNRTLQAYVDAIARTEEEWIENNPRNESVVTEKAKSKSQQRFMGMVHACKTSGQCASSEVEKVAAQMKAKDAKDFAKTKHKGLPEHKKKKVTETISFKTYLFNITT